MLKPRLFFFLLALTMVGAVGYVLHSHSARTPESLLAAANDRLSSEKPDFDSALRELNLALELALAEENRALAQDIFMTRAQTYMRRKALPKAREDYEVVLDQFLPGSSNVTLQIGWIDLDLGNFNEALAAADSVLKDTPKHSEAHLLRGSTLRALADVSLAEVETQTQAFLADEPAKRAQSLAWTAATLDFEHTYRNAVLSEFDEVCAGEDTAAMRKMLEAATICLMQARQSYVAALEKQANVSAMVGLLDLMRDGKRWTEIVDFGLAASSHKSLHRKLPAVEALVEALDQLGRPALASTVLSKATEEDLQMPVDLLGTWCRLLYEAEDWNRLERIGQAMQRRKGNSAGELRKAASLFVGIAKLRLGKAKDAISQLQIFTSKPPDEEPIENALAEAFYALSQAHREAGSQGEEYKALVRATSTAPGFSGEAWQRLAELQIARGEPMANASESLVHAIGLLPGKVDELIPVWEQVSLQAMTERRRNLDGLKRYLREKGRWVASSDESAVTWEFWKLGRDYLETNKAYGAVEASRAFLKRYPDHVLGLDLKIEADAKRGFWRKLVESLIYRMQLVGPHPGSLDIVAEIPPTRIEPSEFLVMMELDPKNTGLLRMVEELQAEERDQLAIAGLRSIPDAQMQTETRLLLGRLFSESGQGKLAIETVAPIPADDEAYAAALELTVQAATSARQPLVLRQVLHEMSQKLPEARLTPDETIRTARWLLAHDELRAARQLLERLDESGTRTGETLDALAVCLTADGDAMLAEETLDRAEAFLPGPESYVSRVLFLAESERWTEVPGAIETLRSSDYQPGPWVDAALLALEERVAEAATLAFRQVEEGAPEPEWYLVLRAANAMLPAENRLPSKTDPYPAQTALFVGAEDRDPREVFLYLAAVQTPSGSAWAYSRLSNESDTAGRLWPAWLRAKALRHLGQHDYERPILLELAKSSPAFQWSWDRLHELELERLGSMYDPAFGNFLERRLTALGPSERNPEWNAIVRAQRMTRQGAVAEAIRFLERSIEGLPQAPLGLVTLARLQRQAALPSEAVVSFGAALSQMPAREARAVMDEFLELGTAAFEDRTISGAAWRAQLTALRTQLPDDPLISLAWARFERFSTKDPVRGWTLAREEYYRFRESTFWQALDELRPGSAAAWAEFFLSENPREAELMIREELPLSPGSPDLWRMLAESLESQGKVDDAFDRYLALINILPEPSALRAAADILAQRGSDHALLERTLSLIQGVEHLKAADPSLELMRAISLSRDGEKGVEQAMPLFDLLWNRRDQLSRSDEIADLGLGYTVALLHRNDKKDGDRAMKIVDELTPLVSDTFDRDYLRALSHLGRWAPRKKDEDQEQDDAGGDEGAPVEEDQAAEPIEEQG
ncbi:MAG: hypothetical protein AAF682_03755 [Planctomycetota bacterium]